MRRATRCSPRSRGRSGRPDRVRAGRQRLHRRRGGAVAARRAGLIERSADVEALARDGAGQRRRVLRAGLRRAGRAALGPVRARHDRRPHARHDARRTSRARRWKRSPSRSPMCSTRWSATRGMRSEASCAWTAARAANDLLMQFQADLLGVPVVRPTVTGDDGARRGLPRRARGGLSGTTSPTVARQQRAGERVSSPALDAAQRDALVARWRRRSSAATAGSEAVNRRRRHARAASPSARARWDVARGRRRRDRPGRRGGCGGARLSHACCSSASDFAKGTSSRSTKLVHGGVRYLQQGNIALVREALQERGLLLPQRAAPGARSALHRADATAGGRRRSTASGLKLYDLLAGELGLGALAASCRPRATRARSPTLQPRRPARRRASTTTASSTTRGCRHAGADRGRAAARRCAELRAASTGF